MPRFSTAIRIVQVTISVPAGVLQVQRGAA